MLYLVHTHWLLFFGALVLGIGVGWLTYLPTATRWTDRPVHIAIGVVAVGAVVAITEVVPGRAGYWLELGVNLVLVYAVGCFIGWALREFADYVPAAMPGSAASAAATGSYFFRDAHAGRGSVIAFMRRPGDGGPARERLPLSTFSLAQAPEPGGYTFPRTLPVAGALAGAPRTGLTRAGYYRHWAWRGADPAGGLAAGASASSATTPAPLEASTARATPSASPSVDRTTLPDATGDGGDRARGSVGSGPSSTMPDGEPRAAGPSGPAPMSIGAIREEHATAPQPTDASGPSAASDRSGALDAAAFEAVAEPGAGEPRIREPRIGAPDADGGSGGGGTATSPSPHVPASPNDASASAAIPVGAATATTTEGLLSAPSSSPGQPATIAAVPGEEKHVGERPEGLMTARDNNADDLKRIRGIGPQNEGRLHGLGIWHFDQIAAWTPDNVRWVGSYLAFPGRIDREKWLEQAKVLADGGTTEFSQRMRAGKVATSVDDGSQGQSNIADVTSPRRRPSR